MKLTKKDVAVLALAELGGATKVIDTEDAAIAAHAIDPAAFGWKKFADRVDLDVARTTLRHEGEGKQPRIEGSVQHGWHLTPEGVAWIDENASLIHTGSESVAATSAATQRWRAETRDSGATLNRIRTSEAFRLWANGGDFTARQAAELFRIDEYTPTKERSRKAARVQDFARGDAEIEEFMKLAIPAAMALRAPVGRNEEEK